MAFKNKWKNEEEQGGAIGKNKQRAREEQGRNIEDNGRTREKQGRTRNNLKNNEKNNEKTTKKQGKIWKNARGKKRGKNGEEARTKYVLLGFNIKPLR